MILKLLSSTEIPSTPKETSGYCSSLSSWSNFASTSRVLFIVVLLSLTNGYSVQCFAILNKNDLGSRLIRSNKQNAITSRNHRRGRIHLHFHPTTSRIRGGDSSCTNTGTALLQSTTNNGNNTDDFPRGGDDDNKADEKKKMPTMLQTEVSTWPCMDKLDKDLIRISLPVIGNNAISPLIGAVDLFWVNRMGNALAVAGQAAANQVFNSVFWFTSFLPSGT